MSSARSVASRFNLGVPTSELRPVVGGRSNRLFRLSTDRGDWAVKLMTRVDEDWWLDRFNRSAELEVAAAQAGVRVPRPVVPTDAVASLLAEMELDGKRESVRVSAWIDGVRPSIPPSRELCRWVGATVAGVAQLRLPAEEPIAEVYRPHPLEDWADWIEEAEAVGLELAPALRNSLPLISDANALVSAAADSGASLALLHWDTSPYNVLISPAGPWLLDWDSAGPDVPWFEAVRCAWRFASSPRGDDVQAAGVREVLAAYAEAGEPVGRTDEQAFAGLVRATAKSMAYFLWRALGHRPITTQQQVDAEAVAALCLGQLRSTMTHLAEYVALLDEAVHGGQHGGAAYLVKGRSPTAVPDTRDSEAGPPPASR